MDKQILIQKGTELLTELEAKKLLVYIDSHSERELVPDGAVIVYSNKKFSETGENAPPPPSPPAKEKLVKVRETEKGEPPPPPPPPPNDEKEAWVDYDSAPEVVGGFGEVAKVLKYPESARKSGITGFVDVTLQIDEEGKVVDSKIKKSLQPDCDKAALEALKSVKWKPALKDGKPVKVWVTGPVKFALK